MTSAIQHEVVPPPSAGTGIPGLDAILNGGLPRAEMHLIQGGAGTGKTTIGLQFLIEGVRLGEPTLYLTLSQSSEHLARIASSHGWTLDGITVHELAPATLAERIAANQSILPTTEVKLEEAFLELVQLVHDVAHVVFDGWTGRRGQELARQRLCRIRRALARARLHLLVRRAARNLHSPGGTTGHPTEPTRQIRIDRN